MKNIETTTDPWVLTLSASEPLTRWLLHRGKAVADADLVVEAIIESLKVKRDLFGFLDAKAK